VNDAVTNEGRNGASFMGVAPVDYSPALKLSSLSGSDLSLRSIGSGFDEARNFFAVNASRNNFLDQFYRYNIIHLYTHASANDNKEPVIYFADSALYLNELVIKQKPVTQLVVLAACETGLGKFYQGEGVFSFNRGFAAIGIPSSIVNLWPVDNKTTYELNELFYEYLSKGLPIDIALQKAKLEYISKVPAEKALPYYWAATVLAGESEPLITKKGWSPSWTSLLIIPFVFILWMLFRRISRRTGF
jgi:CHAT domain-containing protein